MTEQLPPNGRPGYKDLYDAINELRHEFNSSLTRSEERILAELRAAEHRRLEDALKIKADLREDISEGRRAHSALSITVSGIRDQMLRAGAVFAVVLIMVNFLAPLVLARIVLFVSE